MTKNKYFLVGLLVCTLSWLPNRNSEASQPAAILATSSMVVTVRGQILVTSPSGISNNNGLTVLLKDNSDGSLRGIGTTNSDGIFYIQGIAPGRYLLEIYFLKSLVSKYEVLVPSDRQLFKASPDGSALVYDIPPIRINNALH